MRGVRLMINLFHFSHFGAHYCVGFFFPLNVCGIKALFFHLLYFQDATRDGQTEEQRRNVGFQTRAPCGEQLSESVVIDAPAYGENVEAGFWWHIKFDARIEKIVMGFRNAVRDLLVLKPVFRKQRVTGFFPWGTFFIACGCYRSTTRNASILPCLPPGFEILLHFCKIKI